MKNNGSRRKVKICGLTNAVDALAARAAGADALGFVMGGLVLPLEIEPAAQSVRSMIRSHTLNRGCSTYLVTHLLDADDIIALAEYLGVTGVQISEPLDTPSLAKVRERFHGEIIKTVVTSRGIDELKRVEAFCDSILLDSHVSGYIGGTGVVSDWSLSEELIRAAQKPVWLAGGLTPQNIEDAIRQTNAARVDVSTGVSCFGPEYPRKDRKDQRKIERFIAAVRGGRP